MRFPPRQLTLPLIVLLLCTSACSSYQRRKQLQRVARDWCETIRASQIIPVYPPTADLFPGDLFLVERTIADQHEEYEERGFLALPYHLSRLKLMQSTWASAYRGFNDALIGSGMPGQISANRSDQTSDALSQAFTAAFPSYGFEVRSGGAFDLAIPISGVPAAISALSASSAKGSITIKDVRTYGVTAIQLQEEVERWRSRFEVQAFLKQTYATVQENGDRCQELYVRAVSRVYAARSFDISVTATSQVGVGVAAGLALENGSTPQTADDLAKREKDIRDSLNKGLKDARTALADAGNGGPGFGGKASFTSVSSRSVGLKEEFDEPIVVGYLGLDFAVLKDGALGPPIPTFLAVEQQLEVPGEQESFAPAFTGASARLELALDNLERAAKNDPARVAQTYYRAAEILDQLPTFLRGHGMDQINSASAFVARAPAANDLKFAFGGVQTNLVRTLTMSPDQIQAERTRIASALELAWEETLDDRTPVPTGR